MALFFDEEFSKQFLLDVPKKILASHAASNNTYASLSQYPQVWSPTVDSIPDAMFPGGFSGGEPIQYCTITRKRVQLSEWGNLTIGYLKGIPIRRRNIITYVANKLGGIHYDSSRFFSKKDERAEFKLLAEAYDWESNAIMHAGLVVIALACIELTSNPTLLSLLFACEDFEKDRVKRVLDEFPAGPPTT